MKQKHIDASREVRLWLGQILIPVAGIFLAFPQAREWAYQKYVNARTNFKVY